jgi:hypothetical protein
MASAVFQESLACVVGLLAVEWARGVPLLAWLGPWADGKHQAASPPRGESVRVRVGFEAREAESVEACPRCFGPWAAHVREGRLELGRDGGW